MTVKIRRERPDQRRHHRVTAPLFVVTGGERVRAADWSLGGLRVEAFPGELPATGANIPLDLTLPFQGFDVSFAVKAEVVRTNPTTGMFAVRFTEIGERERELMQHFIEELVRGAMTDVEDTIQRIDVPVTPASLQPDPKPSAPQIAKHLPPKRLPLKTMAISSAYILAGALIFIYAAVLGYTNFFRLEVKTAVITAPAVSIEAQVDGRVDLGGLKPGDPVSKGDVLLEIYDAKLERELAMADLEIKKRKAKLSYLKSKYASELERIEGFATVEIKNVRQAKLDIEATEADLASARRNEKRLRHLFDRGYTTAAKMEEAETRVIQLEKRLEHQRIELTSRAELAKSNIGKRLYTGDDFIGKSDDLRAEVALASHEVELAEKELAATRILKVARAIKSPFTGTVLKLPRLDDTPVRRGDVVAIVEQRRKREVTAFLTQDEVLKIGLGDDALLYIPALGESVKGRVVAIDRTSGFFREQDQRVSPGYGWRGPKDRTARVTLRFEDPEKVADSERYRSGLPVVVVFEQRTTNALFSAMRNKLPVSL